MWDHNRDQTFGLILTKLCAQVVEKSLANLLMSNIGFMDEVDGLNSFKMAVVWNNTQSCKFALYNDTEVFYELLKICTDRFIYAIYYIIGYEFECNI